MDHSAVGKSGLDDLLLPSQLTVLPFWGSKVPSAVGIPQRWGNKHNTALPCVHSDPPALTRGTEQKESVSPCSCLPPPPAIFSLSSCQAEVMTFPSHSSCPTCLSSRPSPPPCWHTVGWWKARSGNAGSHGSKLEINGNKWKQASASDSTGPRAQGPTSHPQRFFLLLTMCYDWVAESPTANDSNSAQSWQK